MRKSVYLSLGSNLGDRAANLREAIERLRGSGEVTAVSSFYETEPVDVTAQPWFLNCAVALATEKMPRQLLTATQSIEQEMGRRRTQPKGPRVIDIDILLFASSVVDLPQLTIPHPAMHQRRFVLEPLAEIAPDVRHPVFKRRVRELLAALPPGQSVKKAGNAPLGDEQIRSHTVGELLPLSETIEIVDYDSRWPELFRREEKRLRGALGGRALRIEHTGSTSVPGLAAKPVIDILLVVADSADEACYLPDLERAGYVLRIREPDWNQHRMLKGPGTDINLHVLSAGCAEVERMLLFRDWLRNNAAERELYARAKRELAAKHWKYVQNYADAKTAIVEEILQRARRGTTAR